MRMFILALLYLTACSHQPSSAPTPAAASPSALAAVRALETKKIKEVKAQPYFEFRWGDRAFRVAHGQWRIAEDTPGWNRMYGYGPVVWVTTGGKTRVLDLRQAFPSNFVAQVFHDETSGRILLFLDYGIEGPAEAYHVWISEDRGEHWFAGEDLPRPPGSFPSASLESLFLDHRGRGTAWFKMEVSYLPPEARGEMHVGADVYYRAQTNDGGRTWLKETTPIFSSTLRQEEEKHH